MDRWEHLDRRLAEARSVGEAQTVAYGTIAGLATYPGELADLAGLVREVVARADARIDVLYRAAVRGA